ncbi:MAG TPA: hypothetical protein DD415_05185 [Clostridiales bacterium]|nr:hypothetical protein [Clostridiales bacterium]
MSKLNLVAMAYDKDAVLNALSGTGAVEIKSHGEEADASPLAFDCDELRTYLSRLDEARAKLADACAKAIKEDKSLYGGGEISFAEFMAAKELRARAEECADKIFDCENERKKIQSAISRLDKQLEIAKIYSGATEPLKSESTAHVKFRLGAAPAAGVKALEAALAGNKLAAYSIICGDAENSVIMVAAHKSIAEETDGALSAAGFADCPFAGDKSGEQIYRSLVEERKKLESELEEISAKLVGLKDELRPLEIYCDYTAFELEKAELSEKMLATQKTILIEAYVPEEEEERVSAALSGTGRPLYFGFSKPSEEETPPTLLKNNKVVKNFEAVTNMYSPPNYREFDPNTIMAFFYSVFLGFIMADIGYGLMMIIGGLFVKLKTNRRDTMLGRLGGVFAVGGIFTIIWGFLFNSFFGFALLPFRVMPDMQGAAMSWSLAGIKVPALLIISMIIGVCQLFAGYVCLAVQDFRRGKIWDGVWDGIVWAVFSAGVELALCGFIDEFGAPVLKLVGGIIAGISLLTAILTAGRKEKLLGKFTKGFGSAYGVINYASDILSYARLYGLMLAGAVIADIVTSNSVALMSSGNVALIILGVLIMVIGHVFNLAIGLLGAYIHDARLQYVEFYGRFYEGEGELFAPLGSKHKYVYITN